MDFAGGGMSTREYVCTARVDRKYKELYNPRVYLVHEAYDDRSRDCDVISIRVFGIISISQ